MEIFNSDEAEGVGDEAAEPPLPGGLPGNCGRDHPQAQVHVRVRAEGGTPGPKVAVFAVRRRTLRDDFVQSAQQGNRQGQGEILDLLEPAN